MKYIIKTIIFAFCIITAISCEDEINPKVSANVFALRSSGGSSSTVLLPQNDADTVVTLNWDKSDNGTGPSVSVYQVEIAESGTNFAHSFIANSGNNITTIDRSYVLTVKELNAFVNQFEGYQCGSQISVDIRIRAILGQGYYNEFVQYSSVATVMVTPYSTALPALAFSSTGAVDGNTPKLAASGVLNTDYEGYMYLNAGTYKFYKPNNSCNLFDSTTVYGDDNTSSGTLAENGAGYVVSTAGFYLVTANLPAGGPLTYLVRPTTWNVFGTAKPLFPAANIALVYDQASNVWKNAAPISFGDGFGFKFRSNGTGPNALVLGKFAPASVNTSAYAGTQLSYVANDLFNEVVIPGAKTPRVNRNYNITLDLSKPRNYTYTLTVIP